MNPYSRLASFLHAVLITTTKKVMVTLIQFRTQDSYKAKSDVSIVEQRKGFVQSSRYSVASHLRTGRCFGREMPTLPAPGRPDLQSQLRAHSARPSFL